MKSHTFLPFVLVVLATTVTAHGQCDFLVSGEAIMRVKPGVSIEDAIAYVEPLIEAHDSCTDVIFTVEEALASRGIYKLSFEPATCSDAVEIEFDLLRDAPANTTSLWGELLYLNFLPESDTGSIWFHSISGFEQYNDQYAGQGVVVAVVDTGIDETHPLLADVIAPGGLNVIGPDPTDTTDVGDGIDNDKDKFFDEAVGHGTFVASLIHLTAPDATLLPVVVVNSDGVGDLWDLTVGILHASAPATTPKPLPTPSRKREALVSSSRLQAGTSCRPARDRSSTTRRSGRTSWAWRRWTHSV